MPSLEALEMLIVIREDNPALLVIEEKTNYRRFTNLLYKAFLRQIREMISKPNFKEIVSSGDFVALRRIIPSLSLPSTTIFNFYWWVGNLSLKVALDKIILVERKVKRAEVEGLYNQEILTVMRERSDALLSHMDTTTSRQIRDFIAKGWEEGKKIEDIANGLVAKFENISWNRARVITETETNWAVSETELRTFADLGYYQVKWMTAKDDRVCPICLPLDGVVFSTGSPIRLNNNDWLNLPGNFASTSDILHPPVHCRCRCFLMPVQTEAYGKPPSLLPLVGIVPMLEEIMEEE